MALKFFGRGSAFSDTHTSAYFTTADNDFVIIDCSITTLWKIKHIDLKAYENIYVLITHTHGDHVDGLGLLVQYMYFNLKKILTVVAPCTRIYDFLLNSLVEGGGNDTSWFKIITTEKLSEKEWFKKAILTTHTPQLHNRCFGYNLTVDGQNIVYTGDTTTIVPFLPYLTEGSILYVDTSVYNNPVHLSLECALDDFLALNKRNIQVYLMHLDNVEIAEKIVAPYPDINVVTLD